LVLTINLLSQSKQCDALRLSCDALRHATLSTQPLHLYQRTWRWSGILSIVSNMSATTAIRSFPFPRVCLAGVSASAVWAAYQEMLQVIECACCSVKRQILAAWTACGLRFLLLRLIRQIGLTLLRSLNARWQCRILGGGSPVQHSIQ